VRFILKKNSTGKATKAKEKYGKRIFFQETGPGTLRSGQIPI
jgi:hypothetical protein